MAYNRFLYNEALYNAGREEVGAVAKSLIQAHTGPHIQAVVGSDPTAPSKYGISFISDFVIQEGTVTKPPASFNFPDLSAHIKALFEGVPDDLGSWIRGWYSKDLPAGVYPVDEIPDLPARIFALLESNLIAIILGELAEKDLGARIFVPIADLLGVMSGVVAPDLGGRVFSQRGKDLGARIGTPFRDIPAILSVFHKDDLPADIHGYGSSILSGFMHGYPEPKLYAYLRVFASGTLDLPGDIDWNGFTPGFGEVPASIEGYKPDLSAFLRVTHSGVPRSLIGKIFVGTAITLPAIIAPVGAKNLSAYLSTAALGEKDRFFPAYMGGLYHTGLFRAPAFDPVHSGIAFPDLAGYVLVNSNLKNLSAILESSTKTADLGAFIRVAETFITAILTVITMSARDLRATLGSPECEGGTGYLAISASLLVQHARDLAARLSSLAELNLGASVNALTIIHALDVIDVFFSSRRDKKTRVIWATDTVNITYSPFRGRDLRASIASLSPSVDLSAVILPAFPLLSVAPQVSRITAADLRLGEELNVQELRFQLEGALTEYLYVHGTDDAFILDPDEQWQLNVRSFKPIAENMFGDFAASRACRLGSLVSYATIDEAVRACIAAVLGLEGQVDLGAALTARGQWQTLQASLEVSDVFSDLSAVANRVFPADLGPCTVSGTV